jgi:hypothetical protein
LSSTSNVPALTIDATGVTVPESTAILSGVLADINDAFGGNLQTTTASSPQGAMAADTTGYIQAANAEIAYVVSMVDPATSEGRFQDAIGRIYYLYRKGATASVVNAQLTGQSGVTIPAGSATAQDDAGNTWVSNGDATFSGSGLATVEFACATLGAVSLGIGQLTRIAQTYAGWDAITNLEAATVGTATETRAEFEARRAASVAKNAHGSVAAIFGNVSDISGVIDVFTVDNFTGATVNYGATNYPLAPHSIYVGVVGGTDADVAQAIFEKKDCGCDMNGNTSVSVQDTATFVYPYPTQTIRFNRPTSVPIKFAVQLQSNSNLPANIVSLVQAAILSSFTGGDGGDRARVGSSIFASRYYANVAATSSAAAILSILIGTSTATLNTLTIGIDQEPTLSTSDISVTLV